MSQVFNQFVDFKVVQETKMIIKTSIHQQHQNICRKMYWSQHIAGKDNVVCHFSKVLLKTVLTVRVRTASFKATHIIVVLLCPQQFYYVHAYAAYTNSTILASKELTPIHPKLFHDEGPCYIETSPLICRANRQERVKGAPKMYFVHYSSLVMILFCIFYLLFW